jgi:hypothetical protein
MDLSREAMTAAISSTKRSTADRSPDSLAWRVTRLGSCSPGGRYPGAADCRGAGRRRARTSPGFGTEQVAADCQSWLGVMPRRGNGSAWQKKACQGTGQALTIDGDGAWNAT